MFSSFTPLGSCSSSVSSAATSVPLVSHLCPALLLLSSAVSLLSPVEHRNPSSSLVLFLTLMHAFFPSLLDPLSLISALLLSFLQPDFYVILQQPATVQKPFLNVLIVDHLTFVRSSFKTLSFVPLGHYFHGPKLKFCSRFSTAFV